MKFESYFPCDDLKNFIQYYWVGFFDNSTASALRVSVQPITMQNLLFFLEDAPFRLNNGKVDDMSTCTLIGMISQTSAYFLAGKVKIIGVRFSPIGFSRLFKVPPAEFTDQATDFCLTDKEEINVLTEQLYDQSNDPNRMDILNNFFTKKLRENKDNNDLERRIQWSVNQINTLKGRIKVGEIANQLNLSERHFRRLFYNKTGLQPKTFSDIVRYNEAYKMFLNRKPDDWYDIVYKCGYYDQAHFIHDFKRFTGMSPAAYESDFKEFDNFHRR